MQNDTEQFHDSESGDIYDLYNACNGVIRDGFLDVEELNNYTPDEAEELNVPRLREIWEHTKTDCLKCRQIINALDIVRRKVDEVAPDLDSGDDPEPGVSNTRSIF